MGGLWIILGHSMDDGSPEYHENETLHSNTTDHEATGHLNVFQSVATCVMAVVIITGNILVSIVAPRMARLHKTVAYFMAQLALADIMVGLCMPLHLAMVLYRPMLENIDICVLRYTTVCFTESASLGCLLVMTVDCFVKVTYPLHYPVWMTKRCCVALSCAVWLFAIVIGFLLPTLWHNDWSYNQDKDCDFVLIFKYAVIFIGMGYFTIISLAMLILYSSIILTVRKQTSQFKFARQTTRINQTKQGNLTLRMSKTCLIVVGLFLLCWLPLQIFTGVQIIGGQSDNQTLAKCRTITTFLAIFNSALNPFIYAVRLPHWRRSLKNICAKGNIITSLSGSVEMKHNINVNKF